MNMARDLSQPKQEYAELDEYDWRKGIPDAHYAKHPKKKKPKKKKSLSKKRRM
jgi:hypothetical protein